MGIKNAQKDTERIQRPQNSENDLLLAFQWLARAIGPGLVDCQHN